MTNHHVIRRHQRVTWPPASRTVSRFGLLATTSLMLLALLHFTFTRMVEREMAVFQEEYEDQIQRPPVVTSNTDPTPENKAMLGFLDKDDLLDDSYKNDKDDLLDDSYKNEMAARRQTYVTQCAKGWEKTLGADVRSFITHDDDIKMGYCFVAKIGCTFWLRIFTFLTRKADMLELGLGSPFDIDRIALHSGQLMTKVRRRYADFRRLARPDTIKFLFTRNPYERLWSVYLDKYYLPDYWMHDPLGLDFCGINTTFTQFLNAAVTSKDHHVTPVASACNPCVFQPDVIGKMETFSRDSKRILDQAGYSSFMANYNHSAYVEIELTSLVVYNFKLLKGIEGRLTNCLTAKRLCERLWRVFQINGHIRSTIPFPNDSIDYSLTSATKMFLETVKSNPMTKSESKLQRKRFLAGAYAKITPSTILEIQNRYRADFEMFDYDVNPPSMPTDTGEDQLPVLMA